MLGYQVQNSVESSSELKDWLQKNSDKHLRIWGKTPVGTGCDYGINPEFYPWGDSEVFSFEEKENGNGCSFTTASEYFDITFCELPKDRWGNTATFSGVVLGEGYFEIGYEDNDYVGYEFPSEWELEDESSFLEWVETHHPELVSEITDETICNGIATRWRHITTNKPFDSQEWEQVQGEYQDRG